LTDLAAPLAGQAVWGYLLSGIALVCFSCAVLATKAASNRANLELGFFVALIVNVVIAGGALIIHLLIRGTALQWNTLAFLLFAASGVFATYLGRWFFYESVVRFGPAKASIFQVSSPLFAALLAWLLLGEGLTSLVIIGMVLAISGLALIAYKPGFFASGKTNAATVHTAYLARILQSVFLLGLFSSAAYAVGNLLRGAAVRSWPEPIAGALIGALAGLAMHYFFSADKASLTTRLRQAERPGLWLFALVGAANISGQITTIAAMRYIPLAVAALVGLCTPLLVFPLSYWLFKSQEPLTVSVVLGSLLTLFGVAIIVLR
jgi:drug/metabolite transporter (DMT)-like permease